MKERPGPSPYTPADIERVFGDAYPLEILADKEEAERRIEADQAELDGGVTPEREIELRAQLELNREVLGKIGSQLKRKLASYPTAKT
jgi:hypothetical protein